MTSESLQQQSSQVESGVSAENLKDKAHSSVNDSFEIISGDGQLKKRVLKAGFGERPPVGSQVFGWFYYNEFYSIMIF